MTPMIVRVLGIKTQPKVANLAVVKPDLPTPIIFRSGANEAQMNVVGKVESCGGRSSHPPKPHKLAVITLISLPSLKFRVHRLFRIDRDHFTFAFLYGSNLANGSIDFAGTDSEIIIL